MKCNWISAAYRTLSILQSLASLLILLERFWMAQIFFTSGLLKIADWPNTLFLFASEYNVPVLPPTLAAYAATAAELACPVFLMIGLGSRLATLPMLAMTAVIEFTYADNIQHIFWAMLLATILCVGPGKLSVDYIIRRKMARLKPEMRSECC